jgi:hypothetical protein
VRRLALGCLATIAVADYVIVRRTPRWHAVALFDHPAHVATALLLAGPRLRSDPAYLVGSLLPDVDHIPAAFRSPKAGDPRPKTHSLYAPLAVAPFSPKLAAGMLAHFVRDLALGPGLPLFGGRHYRLPYGAYAVLLLATAYSRSRPCRAAPAHIPGASGRGP